MADVGEVIDRVKPSWANDVAISHVQRELRADGGNTGADIIGQYIVDSNSVRREAADALCALLSERDELREALRPLAAIQALLDNPSISDDLGWGDLLAKFLVTGDFRRAARLLAGKGVKG